MMREHWLLLGIVAIGLVCGTTWVIWSTEANQDRCSPNGACPPSASPTAAVAQSTPRPVDPPATPTGTIASPVSRPGVVPTASPVPAPAYEPIPWDARDRIQRLPPPTEAAALAERAPHRNGFAFGAEPPAFEGVAGGEECGAVSFRTPLRAGDWIIEVDPAAAESQLVLTPHVPDFDRTGIRGTVPWLIRWTQVDGDRERTHVHEQFWGGPGRTFQTPLLLPDAGTWRGVVTYGPNWGCFILEVESAVTIPWMVSEAQTLGASYPTATTPAARIARFQEMLTGVHGLGTPARQCVGFDGLPWARSGEFMTRGDQIAARWSPTRRGSKVAWTPLNQENSKELIVLGASVDALWNTFSYREPWPVESLDADGERSGEFTFITSITPPQAGSWLLIGTAEPGNWGCFSVTVG